MTLTDTAPTDAPSTNGAKRPSLELIRTSGGVELPSTGEWQIHAASFVGVTVDRKHTLRPTVHGARLEIGDSADDPIRLALRTDCSRARVLDLTGTPGADDGYGFVRWTLAGTIEDELYTRPLAGSLRYHGVYRRGGSASAWLSGWVTTRTRGYRRSGLDVEIDLIALPADDA